MFPLTEQIQCRTFGEFESVLKHSDLEWTSVPDKIRIHGVSYIVRDSPPNSRGDPEVKTTKSASMATFVWKTSTVLKNTSRKWCMGALQKKLWSFIYFTTWQIVYFENFHNLIQNTSKFNIQYFYKINRTMTTSLHSVKLNGNSKMPFEQNWHYLSSKQWFLFLNNQFLYKNYILDQKLVSFYKLISSYKVQFRSKINWTLTVIQNEYLSKCARTKYFNYKPFKSLFRTGCDKIP